METVFWCLVGGFAGYLAIVAGIKIADSFRHHHRWVNYESNPDGTDKRGYRRLRVKEFCPECDEERVVVMLLPNGHSSNYPKPAARAE